MPANPGYLYFPGCSLKAAGIAYEESLIELFRLLDLPLEELNDWNCCGATSYMSIDESSAFLLSARNLSLAANSGNGAAEHKPPRDLLAPCSACYLVLRKTQNYAGQYPEVRRRIEESFGNGSGPKLDAVRVRHPLEVLYTDVGVEMLRSKMVRRWRGGRIACYYGCQIVRPYDEVDRAHNPTRMDELLEAVGASTVDYALKTKCCGGTLTGTMHDVGIRLNYILLKEAARKGADAIVTVCPLCQFNLDAYQSEISRESGERLDIPILYFTQVLGWALGGDPTRLGIRRSIAGRGKIDDWFSAREEVESYV